MKPVALEIVTTVSAAEHARELSRHLVESRLAACVQVEGPLESHYRWNGELETSQEWRCTIKTSIERGAEVQAAILKLHSYDVPEILIRHVDALSGEYQAWLTEQVRSSAD